jgi:hypothetical protein
MYRYGLEFTIHENKREHLVQLLNRFALQIKKSPLVPGSRFVNMDKFSYLKNIVAKKTE